MGYTTFLHIHCAQTADLAYRMLVAQALHARGGGRNGTIAATRGFEMVSFQEGESAPECYERMIEAAASDDYGPGGKSGAAACLDLGLDLSPYSTYDNRYMFFGRVAC